MPSRWKNSKFLKLFGPLETAWAEDSRSLKTFCLLEGGS